MVNKKIALPKYTRKRMKIVGVENYIKESTGEITEMHVVDFIDRDFNFHKIWLNEIVRSIDLIGNKKVKLAFWIIENLDKENKLVMTLRQIVKKSGFSYQTAQRTINALIESDFLIRINTGAYRVNPNALFKGGKNDRFNVLMRYIKESEESNNESESKAETTETDEKQSNVS